MVNRELKKALLEKLGISVQALSQRAQKMKRLNAMTTEEAHYVIAQQNEIILDKYLDSKTIERVGELMQRLQPSPQSGGNEKRQISSTKTRSEKLRIIVIPKEFEIEDPILSKTKALQAKEMAAFYPLLYVLENSIRELIDKVMISIEGENWWVLKAPSGLKKTVEKRMADEIKNSWHQRRGSQPIDYLDLNQLPALVRQISAHIIPDLIPSIEWFNQFIEEVYKSRCVICHMNPLDKNNIVALKVRFKQWQKQIKAKFALIPE